VLAAVLAGTQAWGDVVYMNNGDRITGDIKRVWDNELFLETPYADEFPISLDAVARIESDEPFEIELRDHSEITGSFGVDESGAMVLITETETRPFSPMGIEELSEPEERFDWDARSDFSYRATRGNTETTNFLWQAAGGVKIGDHRHRGDFSFDRIDQDGLTTKEQYTANYVYSWFFSDDWFLASGIGYERDPIRELTYRYTPGGGLGYQFFDDAYRQFEVVLSAVGVREKLGGVTEDSSAARWDLRYRRDMLGGDLEFFHNHRLWVYVTGRTNRVVDTSTGFRWDVWGDIYMNVQVDWDWESEPAAGNEQEDITYALGIGIELD
jgi:putative salt-induced outer membrane protein YdiY